MKSKSKSNVSKSTSRLEAEPKSKSGLEARLSKIEEKIGMEIFMGRSMETRMETRMGTCRRTLRRILVHKFLWSIVLVAILLLSGGFAQCREMPYFWKGVRPLGMGGAFTAVADDYNALFYNPAGLDKVQHWSFALLNPLAEAGENSQDLYKDINDTDFDNTSEVTELLRKHVGEHQHVRAAVLPYFVKQHFGFGVLGQATVDAEVNNPQYPEADISAVADVAGVCGLGFGFLDNHALRVGASAKFVQRKRLQETYTAIQIADDNFDDTINDDTLDGSGIGFDLGALYTFSAPLEPTVAMVIQNVGKTNLGDAGEIPQQVNLGAGIHFDYSFLSVNAAVDAMDITANVNEDEKDFFRRLHMGAESWLGERLGLRLGLYQGYFSAGATLNLWVLKLDYANYAEEVGAYAGQRVDRRNVVQISFGW